MAVGDSSMEDYPADYVTHNLPLLALSGLGNGSHVASQPDQLLREGRGLKLSSDIPPLAESKATKLREVFLTADGSDLAWNPNGFPDQSELGAYKIICIERVGQDG